MPRTSSLVRARIASRTQSPPSPTLYGEDGARIRTASRTYPLSQPGEFIRMPSRRAMNLHADQNDTLTVRDLLLIEGALETASVYDMQFTRSPAGVWSAIRRTPRTLSDIAIQSATSTPSDIACSNAVLYALNGSNDTPTAPDATDAGTVSESPTSSRRALNWLTNFSDFQAVYGSIDTTTMVHPVRDDSLVGSFGFTATGEARPFGLEIEVDFPHSRNYGYERNELARRMHQAGYAFDGVVNRWHAAGRRRNPDGTTGYTRALNGWSVEFDRSVDDCGGVRGAEIVSPILTDSTETWNTLEGILAIVKELNGETTVRTGLHVNIGVPDMNARMTVNLGRMAAQFDDLIVRLAHTPEVGARHRGRGFCSPVWFRESSAGSALDAEMIHRNNGHTSAVNMSHVAHPSPVRRSGRNQSSRLEFRTFDGTLEIGRIQAYVMLCMAMTHVSRGVDNVHVVTRDPEAGGAHVLARGGTARRLSGTQWRNDTERIREFVDALGVNAAQAKAFVVMYKNSRWAIA